MIEFRAVRRTKIAQKVYYDSGGPVLRFAAKKQGRQHKQGNGLGEPQSLCHPDIIAGDVRFA
jgi:hypothetical protein